ncbi:hypothetical protein ACH35V_40700 [Actinomadura sp. 1N219]|uniref:hypothetical protein n=1 Tax=Actinomadura sp. 1N219 TaxID=3375152 RepID=UPI003797322E
MEFHFIITLLFPNHGGMAYATYSGVVSAGPGETRQDMYDQVWALVQDAHSDNPGIARANIVCFALEPNQLPVTV